MASSKCTIAGSDSSSMQPLMKKTLSTLGDNAYLPLTSKDMLTMLDILLASSGVDQTSCPEKLVEKFGENNLELILRFYNSIAEKESSESQCSDGMNISEVSDEEETPVGGYDERGKYKKETEIAMSRIFSLGKVVPPVHTHIAPHDPHFGPNVISMTGFGELGRFGNQVMQYMFLRCYAQLVNSEVQVPYWVGKDLFGLEDLPVQRAFPAVIETRTAKANSTFTDDFLSYIQESNGGADVQQLEMRSLDSNLVTERPVNVDIWGWFQWHTSHYTPFKQMLQKTFTPVNPLKSHFDDIIETKLRMNGKRTIVGCHLRLGDYKNIAASSFGYVAPTEWYLEWLEDIWPTLENPILFVASDEVETVLRDFAKFNPVTSESIGAAMPDEFAQLDAGFFTDWYVLSQCDHVAISNSTFSFTACMLNTRPNATFYRAHYAKKICKIDPWDDEVIVHRDTDKSSFINGVETLKVLYETQGTKALLQNVLYELPYYALRSVVMKAIFRARLFSSTDRDNSNQVIAKPNLVKVEA